MGLNNTIFTNESPGLFNGNIAAMMTDIKILATEEDPNVSIYGYAYDQLHRIKKATNYRAVGMGYEGSNKYNTNYSYDPDGNLTNLQRGGQEENNVMDRLSYVYGTPSRPNQLTQVNDQASDGAPGQFSGTEVYDYDDIGNLTETTSNGNLTKIDWDVYNKVKQVTNEGLLTRYLYDGAGNRVLTFKNVGFEDRRPVITGYSRDATGNTLAVYDLSNPEENPFFTPQMQETYIYGSNRIGVDITPRNDLGNYYVDSYHKDLTTTRYEISNHLGNVLTTVTGRKLGQVQNDVLDHYLPEVVTATDYYAFGALMPGRSYENTMLSGTNGYRYAFNGKELDKSGEWGSLNHYDYGFRIYNPSIGKFLSVDPLTASYPWYTPYQFAGNKPIAAIDLDGLEESFAIRMKHREKAYLAGKKTQEEVMQENKAEGVGGIVGAFVVLDYFTRFKISQTVFSIDVSSKLYHNPSKDPDTNKERADEIKNIVAFTTIPFITGKVLTPVIKGGTNAIATLGGGTVKFAKKVSEQKIQRHLKGSSFNDEKGYFENIEDAQKVIDSYNSGKYRLISENPSQNEVLIEVQGVTGTHVSKAKPGSNQTDISEPTNVFMIQSSVAPKPVPVNPTKKFFE